MTEALTALRFEQFGIPLGEPHSSRGPALSAFGQAGLRVNPNTVKNIRKGAYSGRLVEDRIRVIQLLGEINTSNKPIVPVGKNTLFLAVAKTVMDNRKQQSHPTQPGRHERWHSFGLTKSVAETLQQPEHQIRRLLIVMRADFASSVKPGDTSFDMFAEGVDDFCKYYGYGANKTDRSPLAEELESWRQAEKSISDFYSIMYPKGKHRAGRSIGALLSYETPPIEHFYKGNPPITPLDRAVLECYQHGTRIPEAMPAIIAWVRETTGVPADRGTVRLHRDVLIYNTLWMHQTPLILPSSQPNS